MHALRPASLLPYTSIRLARRYLTPTTLLILVTDGRANIPLHGGDPWQESLDAAQSIDCNAILIDTDTATQRPGRCEELAHILGARYLSLEELVQNENFSIVVEPVKPRRQGV